MPLGLTVRGENDADADGKDDVSDAFIQVVAPLSDGELMGPPPFDFASSVALADNTDAGDIAERMFDFAVKHDCGYRVRIEAVDPTNPDLPPREVISTEVRGFEPLEALLIGMLDELHARRQQAEGNPLDG